MSVPARSVIFPHVHVPLARPDGPLWLQALELGACLALGQRALIVGPAGSGKTTLLTEIGRSIAFHHPEVEIHVLVVDGRPEELEAWPGWLPSAQIHGTSYDASVDAHEATTSLFATAAERSHTGADVVLLVDSLASLARVLNVTAGESDRVLTGGLLQEALAALRACFSAARALEPDGSLTIVATAADQTQSEADDVVLSELIATGNMELRLDGALAQLDLFPPLSLSQSGTRRDELILGDEEAWRRADLRGALTDRGDAAGLEFLLEQIGRQGSLDAVLSDFERAN